MMGWVGSGNNLRGLGWVLEVDPICPAMVPHIAALQPTQRLLRSDILRQTFSSFLLAWRVPLWRVAVSAIHLPKRVVTGL